MKIPILINLSFIKIFIILNENSNSHNETEEVSF